MIERSVILSDSINQTIILDGIVYYGNTTIDVLINRERMCRGRSLQASGSFRLLNTIYKPWMIERQNKRTESYNPITEISEFSPNAPFLNEKQRAAYTIPFQRIPYSFP